MVPPRFKGGPLMQDAVARSQVAARFRSAHRFLLLGEIYRYPWALFEVGAIASEGHSVAFHCSDERTEMQALRIFGKLYARCLRIKVL